MALANPYMLGCIAYLLALVAMGAWKARHMRSADDFHVAGRALPWCVSLSC